MAAAISLLSQLGYRVVASAERVEAWARLARDLDPGKLKSTVSEIGLADVRDVAAKILKGQVPGRTVVNVNG